MTNDIDIGFETKPEGLESFLIGDGYVPDQSASDDEIKVYDHEENECPNLYYHPTEGGRNIKALLNINFSRHDPVAIDEAERLSDEVVERFDGVVYDPDGGGFGDSS